MWLFFAIGSALFAGLTAILSKCGIKHTDSNVATAVRTCVVLIFSWLMVFVVGTENTLTKVEPETLLFLILSGLATGASWLCYFRALQLGDVHKVTPLDKSSTVLTMLLAFLFLHEEITFIKAVAMLLIGIGTYLMIEKKKTAQATLPGTEASISAHNWLWFACGSAVFAALTAILGKVGIEGIDSTLGTAIRTIVVLVMAWIVVFITGKQNTLKDIDKSSWFFLVLSGLATGGSWLCYYRALQEGPASIVVPIDKLSILVTIAFSYLVFHETLTKKSSLGLLMIVGGTLLLLVK